MSCQEGCVDFTEAGWDFYSQLCQEKVGAAAEELFRDSMTCLWGTPGQVSLLSVSEEAVLKEVEKVRGGIDDLCGESLSVQHHVTEIIGPSPIDPWWVTHFYQARQGYRADVFYQPVSLEAVHTVRTGISRAAR